MAMVDFRGPSSYQFPSSTPVMAPHRSANSSGQQFYNRPGADRAYPRTGPSGATTSPYSNSARRDPQHSASSTSSPYYHQHPMNANRRTLSTSTTSTSNTTTIPTRTSSTTSSTLGRTASSRSGASIATSSYVALMRKQKATVWCDRAQHEDPRILAAQRIAKIRAIKEVSGGNMEGRSSTGSMGSGSAGIRSKIQHHRVPKTQGYNYANPAGVGVPMRLSATEVGDDGNVRDDGDSLKNGTHQRTNSGRSSVGSNKWLAAANQRQPSRYSQGSIRTSGQGSSPNENIPELEETPMPEGHQRPVEDYFSHPSGQGESGSSSEFESSFGNVGQMKGPTASKDTRKGIEDLRRRGSVDERSNTFGGLGGGGLFVANPD